MNQVSPSRASLALCVLWVAVSGCGAPLPSAVEAPPPEVAVSKSIQKEIAASLEFTGRTEAVENVEIRARVAGHLISVNFEEGEEVKAGDVLFKIDPRSYEAELKAALAQVESAEAKLKKAKADTSRDRQLLAKNAISESEVEMSIALEAVAEAQVSTANASVDNARLNVDFTEVLAPVDGRVGRALMTKGNLISQSQIGEPLTTIVSVKPIDVYFDIDERSLLQVSRRIREEQPEVRASTIREAKLPVQIQLADEEGFPHEGLLDFSDNQVNPDTGTILARARFANEDQFLRPGLFVRVRLPLGEPKVRLLVPERAIGTDQGQRYVLVVNPDNSTARRDVQLGLRHDGGLRIIESGITADDRVVIEGLLRVHPPAPVTPKDFTIEQAAAEQENAAKTNDSPSRQAD